MGRRLFPYLSSTTVEPVLNQEKVEVGVETVVCFCFFIITGAAGYSYQVSDTLLLCLFLMFLQKLGNEEQQEKLLREWLDCCVTEGGVLVAMQKSSRRRNHPLVTQMVEKWLDRYRQIRPCTSLSDGEEDEDDEDE